MKIEIQPAGYAKHGKRHQPPRRPADRRQKMAEPWAAQDETWPLANDGPTVASKRRLRAVVVDDEPAVRLALKEVLGEMPGVEWLGDCASGEEALRRLPEQRPDVVIMDIVMPGPTGLECTRLLREALPESMIIIVSSVPDAADSAKALGANGHVIKPVRSAELQVALEAAWAGQFYRSPSLPATRRETLSLTAPDLLFPAYLTKHAFQCWRAGEGTPDFWLELARRAAFCLKVLAAQLARSERQLERDWERMFGLPPKEWFVQVRLAWIKSLLCRRRDVPAVAGEVGIEGEQHLRREFKRRTGQAIGEFLNQAGSERMHGQVPQQ